MSARTVFISLSTDRERLIIRKRGKQMIEEEYISFETAKLAKGKGLDILCDIGYYIDSGVVDYIRDDYKNMFYPRPAQSLLARWLREVHNMCVEVYSTGYGFIWCICDTDSGTDRRFSNETGSNDSGAWDTYEDAMEAGLQEALKLL